MEEEKMVKLKELYWHLTWKTVSSSRMSSSVSQLSLMMDTTFTTFPSSGQNITFKGLDTVTRRI